VSEDKKDFKPLPPPPQGYRNPPPSPGFMRGLFMAIGIIIMVLSGLCSGSMILSSLSSPGQGTVWMLSLIFGGVPFFIGLATYLLARPPK
jgi:hypothetical protein